MKTAEDENLDDAVLTILITLSAIRPVKTQLVKLGLVQVLSNKLLSLMVTCCKGRCAVSEEPRCAAGIVERIMKVKKTAREDGMVVLWSMCCLYNDGRVKEAVVTSNGVTKMLLVMQSENEVANIDINSCELILHGMGYGHLGQLKMNIIADVDVTFALMEDTCTPVIYVQVKQNTTCLDKLMECNTRFHPNIPPIQLQVVVTNYISRLSLSMVHIGRGAACKDGNNKILPLAFGIGDKEMKNLGRGSSLNYIRQSVILTT
ncbi:hypothetical protein Ddye_005518 [Dipteronia dyeriana]|uniref:U-box domain-containing protein n=1 Tax=Dipteronia dyeriana TaxID=168575 RepID=A0AAD9XGL5_9ROSI|nr:hypothetical protein Ddye_005518 [Dipteronia dyeriana]